MNIFGILIIIFIFAALIFLNTSNPEREDVREKYLEDLTKFLEGTKEKLEQPENSYRILFQHEGQDYFYEDIEDYGFQSKGYKGYLKRKMSLDFTMSFTERTKASVRLNVRTVEDLSTGWLDRSGDVKMPEPLNRFHLYTNNPVVASKFINSPEVFSIFKDCMNVDLRGHPMMSLEITEGVITLRFHPQGYLKPNLIDLKSNVTLIENYFEKFITVENKLTALFSEL